MRVISFRNTILLKRGIWLSAATMMAYAIAPSALNGELWRQPLIGLVPLVVLVAFWAYLLRRTMFFQIADEVVDCGDHLQVRKGRTDVLIAFPDLSAAHVSSFLRMHWITLTLRQPTKAGNRVAFLPQASLWGNLPAIEQLAAQLAARAGQAGGQDPGP